MLKRFMIGYLQRRNYLVLENRIPMLLISGGAVAFCTNEERTEYQVSFPAQPYWAVLNGSYLSLKQEQTNDIQKPAGPANDATDA